MSRLKVTHGDSRDEKKLKRFFPFEIKDHIIPSECKIFSINNHLKETKINFQGLAKKIGLMNYTQNGMRYRNDLIIHNNNSFFGSEKWDSLLQ